MVESIRIINPKRSAVNKYSMGWYPYYAGYSHNFVETILSSLKVEGECTLLDPWNGSGTTTTVANNFGITANGYDLNPVMVLAAKANFIHYRDIGSIFPLCKQIIELSYDFSKESNEIEPLSIWFRPTSASHIRKLEKSLQKVLVSHDNYISISNINSFEKISSIASFFYVALFRTINYLLRKFKPTNPTWIKFPNTPQHRVGPSREKIIEIFQSEVNFMIRSINANGIMDKGNKSKISLASSTKMPAKDESVDLIISSPPYCTRIDYAVATMPELALLGFEYSSSFNQLRRELIGSSTVPKNIPDIDLNWGNSCSSFLEKVYNHDSKASKSYYYKSHLQYFHSIYQSLVEIERVLKPNSNSILVVQDSFYKDIHNDLPKIFIEMGLGLNLECVRHERFVSQRNMAKRNPDVKKYRMNATATESVLIFKK